MEAKPILQATVAFETAKFGAIVVESVVVDMSELASSSVFGQTYILKSYDS
jgi:hypothetical protein